MFSFLAINLLHLVILKASTQIHTKAHESTYIAHIVNIDLSTHALQTFFAFFILFVSSSRFNAQYQFLSLSKPVLPRAPYWYSDITRALGCFSFHKVLPIQSVLTCILSYDRYFSSRTQAETMSQDKLADNTEKMRDGKIPPRSL